MKVVFADEISKADNFVFEFSYSFKGESINLSNISGVILDVNGAFYTNSDVSETVNVTVIGGIDKFINTKGSSTTYPFFISEQQKIALYNLFRLVARRTDFAQIECENQNLQIMLDSLYQNYIG
jgi:hypothetical protein